MTSQLHIPQTTYGKDLVHSIWQTGGSPGFNQEHIIPQGIIEVIFNFGESGPVSARLGNHQCHLPKCFINGYNKSSIQLSLPASLEFFGIRFQPLAIKKIFGTPAREFADKLVDGALVDSSINSLWHQLAEQSSFDNRTTVFLRWLQVNLHDWQNQEKMVNQFLSAIDQHDLSVKQLAGSLCYSPRHLARKLYDVTGMNTEEVLLYKKYLHAVHLIHHSELSLTAIAYNSHFADQSHCIKAFKTYSGITPGDYKRNKSFLKGHLYNNVR